MKASKLDIVLRLSGAVTVAVALWFSGWLIYDSMSLWEFLNPNEYGNILKLSMVFSIALGIELTRRLVTTKKTSKKANNPKPQEPDPEIKKLREELAEVHEKLADIHAFALIMQKRQEANTNA